MGVGGGAGARRGRAGRAEGGPGEVCVGGRVGAGILHRCPRSVVAGAGCMLPALVLVRWGGAAKPGRHAQPPRGALQTPFQQQSSSPATHHLPPPCPTPPTIPPPNHSAAAPTTPMLSSERFRLPWMLLARSLACAATPARSNDTAPT